MSSQLREREPLLAQAPRSRAHPAWLVPLALLASLARGLTLAARVQIVTRISCDALSRATYEPTSAKPPGIPTRCFKDPAVQSSAAEIQMLLTVIVGALTAFTAGRWGKWGDSSGRTKAMSAAVFGLVMAEATYALVSMRHLPFKKHSHKLLLLAPIFEGFFGSWPTLQANMNAYLSDLSPNTSTARIFSRFLGLLYIGFAVGPTIASFILRQSASKGLTPLFFISSATYLVVLLFILIVLPESLHSSNKPFGQENAPKPSPSRSQLVHEDTQSRFLRLLSPLASLRPRRAGALHKDYTLTIIGVSYFIYLMSLALYQLKYLYAEHVFSWDAERLGYYISYMGFARAITLLVLLPMWIYLFRPRPLRRGAGVSPRRELNFDLSLVRLSILLDVLSHGAVVLGPSDSQSWFVLATTLTSLGSASLSSYSSTVLGYMRFRAAQGEQLDQEEDVGVLFGALATIQSLGQTIIGPIAFGLVYSLTVSSYPKGVFVLALSLAGVALTLMCVAKPRKRVILIGTRRDTSSVRGRGRSGVPKDITAGSP
ncbi:hypothetical protein FRB91_003948 [Serendipita sp. 411]|nr:hypothetical protein FRC19_002367 [Serendipita sp. 401]KAG8854149.1 hypothetical protein FRB91_003948 [Serendipita sp. 411]KAG9055124.1 hypothetical protein FS842_003095 [Serendipita sp. 407]